MSRESHKLMASQQAEPNAWNRVHTFCGNHPNDPLAPPMVYKSIVRNNSFYEKRRSDGPRSDDVLIACPYYKNVARAAAGTPCRNRISPDTVMKIVNWILSLEAEEAEYGIDHIPQLIGQENIIDRVRVRIVRQVEMNGTQRYDVEVLNTYALNN